MTIFEVEHYVCTRESTVSGRHNLADPEQVLAEGECGRQHFRFPEVVSHHAVEQLHLQAGDLGSI
jgi:hypothetical protein